MSRRRKQLELPGVPARTTSADIKELVKARLVGYELRQQERARLKAEKKRARESTVVEATQAPLFPGLDAAG